MATGRMYEVTKNEVQAYKLVSRRRRLAKKNGMGVVAIMGVSNGKGAYARHVGDDFDKEEKDTMATKKTKTKAKVKAKAKRRVRRKKSVAAKKPVARKVRKTRKPARKVARKVARKPARKVARKPAKKVIRKTKKGSRKNLVKNATEGFVKVAKSLAMPAAYGTGGFVAHSVLTDIVAGVVKNAGVATASQSIAAVAVALAGMFAASKIPAVKGQLTPIATGMAVSAVRQIVKEFAPEAAAKVGLGALVGSAKDFEPRYHLGEYYEQTSGLGNILEASAGFGASPILEASAGVGEYFSNDMAQVSTGEYFANQLQVQGYGDYEVQPQFQSATAGVGVIEGVLPTDNMDSTFNMMEAAAGLGSAMATGPSPTDQSTYVPYERALAVTSSNSDAPAGIFDIGGSNGILS